MNRPVILPANSPFLTVEQAAALTNYSKRHIYLMCERGEIKHMRIGGSGIRINKAAFLEQIGLTEADYIAAITAEEATPAAVAVAE